MQFPRIELDREYLHWVKDEHYHRVLYGAFGDITLDLVSAR